MDQTVLPADKLQVKLSDPNLSSLSVSLHRRRHINPLTFTFFTYKHGFNHHHVSLTSLALNVYRTLSLTTNHIFLQL